MLLELGEERWDARFLHDEWSQVVLGQALSSREEYFRARRAGRGRTLNRVQRAEVWQLVEQFTKRLTEREPVDVPPGRGARRADREGAGSGEGPRYRHVVVDEAQDLSPAHWMLLRAMAAPGPDDMFLAGDTHQRIYDSYVSLGSLGIAIRGRSTRLTLSYRSTHEILDRRRRTAGQRGVGRSRRGKRQPGRIPVRAPRAAPAVPRRQRAGRTSWPGYSGRCRSGCQKTGLRSPSGSPCLSGA